MRSEYVPISTSAQVPARPLDFTSSELNSAAVALALFPLFSLVVSFVTALSPLNAEIGGSAALLVGTIFLVVHDRRNLRSKGIRPPSGWLALVTVAYLVARRNALRREGVGSPPLILIHLITLVSTIVVSFVILSPLQDARANRDSVPRLEERIEQSLAEQTSTTWSVECPDDAPANTVSSTFGCSASDASGVALTITVTIDAQGVIGFTAGPTAVVSS